MTEPPASPLPDVAGRLEAAAGLTLHAVEPGGVVVLRLEPADLATVDGDRPYVHGGILAACVDTAAWYAVASVAPGEWLAVGLQTDFLRIAGVEPHRVTARPRRTGRTLAVADVEIAPWREPAHVVALGRVTLARAG